MNDGQKLAESVKSTDAAIRESLQRQAGLQRTNTILTAAIACVVILFLIISYNRAVSNFSGEKVQQSLTTHGPEVLSAISNAMIETSTEVVPVYYQEIRVQSVEKMPELAVTFEEQANLLAENAGKQALEQLEASLERVRQQQKLAIREAFPDMTDEEADEFVKGLVGTTADEVHGLAEYFISRTVGELLALNTAMSQFDTKGLPDDDAELSRLFVHYLLLVLDQEIQTMDLKGVK